MTKPAKILHTRVVAGAGGGPDKTILRSAPALDSAAYRVEAAYLHPAGDSGIDVLRATATRFGTSLHTIPERGAVDRRAVRMLLDLCKRLEVDIWHAHDYKTDILGALLRRWHPMKLVTTMHGFTGETWKTRLYARLSHPALRRYDRVLAVSPHLMRYAAQCGVDPDKLRYVPNGIDLSEYKRKLTREQSKLKLGLPENTFAIGVVGRFSVEKGVDRAIRAFAHLHRQRPDTKLHLIGDGPQREELKSLVQELNLTGHVQWWGWQKDTRPVLEAMDALLLPSRTEGLPNAVLEAMAVGLPVAATRVGAVPDVLGHGECGLLLADDETAWASQLLPLIDRPLLGEQFKNNALRCVHEHYSFDLRMRRVAAVYRELSSKTVDAISQQQQAA